LAWATSPTLPSSTPPSWTVTPSPPPTAGGEWEALPLLYYSGTGSLAASVYTYSTLISARLSGTGTLAAAVKPVLGHAAAFAGVGSLRGAVYPNIPFPAIPQFSGTGSLSVFAVADGLQAVVAPIITVPTAAFTGAGTLRPNAYAFFNNYYFSFALSPMPPVKFTGTGTLSVYVAVEIPEIVNTSGAGTLSATARLGAYLFFPQLSGTGALSATAVQRSSVAAALSGSGTLSATAFAQYSTAAGLSGAGTLTASAFAAYPVAAQFTSAGTFSAVAGGLFPYFAGTGTLAASSAFSYSFNPPIARQPGFPYALGFSLTQTLGFPLQYQQGLGYQLAWALQPVPTMPNVLPFRLSLQAAPPVATGSPPAVFVGGGYLSANVPAPLPSTIPFPVA
jgi:hypothetical protein